MYINPKRPLERQYQPIRRALSEMGAAVTAVCEEVE